MQVPPPPARRVDGARRRRAGERLPLGVRTGNQVISRHQRVGVALRPPTRRRARVESHREARAHRRGDEGPTTADRPGLSLVAGAIQGGRCPRHRQGKRLALVPSYATATVSVRLPTLSVRCPSTPHPRCRCRSDRPRRGWSARRAYRCCAAPRSCSDHRAPRRRRSRRTPWHVAVQPLRPACDIFSMAAAGR